MFASEHTRLINQFIGLCKKSPNWPSILADLGYDVQLIEQSISLKNAEKIMPDVVAVSKKLNHAVVTDCKSGANIDSDQDNRYHQLESDDLIYHVMAPDKKQLKHTVCYSSIKQNHKKMNRHTDFPFIIFSRRTIRGEGDFKVAKLNQALNKPISLIDKYEPASYYSFSPDDDMEFILPHVLRGLISYLSKKGKKETLSAVEIDSKDILQYTHLLHDRIDSRHKKILINKIEAAITGCVRKFPNFKEQIDKLKHEEFKTGTFKSLDKICRDIITKYEGQKTMFDY